MNTVFVSLSAIAETYGAYATALSSNSITKKINKRREMRGVLRMFERICL